MIPTARRAAPRTRMEDLVDREAHPPRREVSTTGEGRAEGLAWPTVVALVLLAVFVLAATMAGLMWDLWRPAGHACLGLALSSIVTAYLLGSD